MRQWFSTKEINWCRAFIESVGGIIVIYKFSIELHQSHNLYFFIQTSIYIVCLICKMLKIHPMNHRIKFESLLHIFLYIEHFKREKRLHTFLISLPWIPAVSFNGNSFFFLFHFSLLTRKWFACNLKVPGGKRNVPKEQPTHKKSSLTVWKQIVICKSSS